MRTGFLSIIMALAVLVAGCSSGTGDKLSSAVLARVNGEPVTLDQFEYRMKFLNLGFSNMSGAGANGTEAGLEALSQIIEETMYLQEAKRLGISVPPSEVDEKMESIVSDYPDGIFDNALSRAELTVADFRNDISRKLTIEKLIDAEVYSNIDVGEPEIKAYYEAHADEFRRPEQVRARQIVVEDEELARSILAELEAGRDFASAATEVSLSPDSASGGDLGYFSRGDMPPEFEEIVFNLKPGQLSSVVHTPYGYHIFKVEDVRAESAPVYKDVRDSVKKQIAMSRGESGYYDWLDKLKSGYEIELEPDALGKI